MFRRIMCTVLLLAAIALPMLLIGCQEPNEIRTKRTVTIENKVVDQKEVVQ